MTQELEAVVMNGIETNKKLDSIEVVLESLVQSLMTTNELLKEIDRSIDIQTELMGKKKVV